MNIQVTDTIDTIVNTNLKAVKVLSRYGIDFCSDGSRSLKEACHEANVSFRKLLRNIREAEKYRVSTPPDLSSLKMNELTRFIERYHHRYTHEYIEFIKANLSRLVRRHGKQHPELEELNNIFAEMTAHIVVHMQHEEMIVFPYIREMVRRGRKGRSAIFRSIESPIRAMMDDHQKGNPYLTRLEELTHHYTIPEAAGNDYKVTYQALRDFEQDLYKHLRIEAEILFPMALEMETRYNHLTWVAKEYSQLKRNPEPHVFESL